MPSDWLDGIARRPARGYVRKKWKPRKFEAVANVWHTTGIGPIRRYRSRPWKYGSPFEAAIHIYTKLMNAGPHFVIGQNGEIAQLAPLTHAAWHVGSRKSWPYFRGKKWARKAIYGWWRERWNPKGLASPTELADGLLWRGGSCNQNTIGIEIVPHEDNPYGPWTQECWETIRGLTRRLEAECGIPIDIFHQVSHSDAHPRARTTRAGEPWDPRPDAWDPNTHVRWSL